MKKIISTSTFLVQPGEFWYVKVSKFPDSKKHFMISQDSDEITVLTKKENVQELEIIKKNPQDWKLIALNLSAPFTAGFLAIVTSAIAKEKTNSLIVSTYSKDYVIARKEHLNKVVKALKKLGLKEAK